MLKEWEKSEKPSEEEIKARLEAVKEKLARQQLLIKEKKVPVLVVLEGWGTAGKGYAIGQIIQNIDPRFFKVATMSAPTAEELRYPFLYRYFKQIPEAGKFTFLDSGWMEQTCKDCLSGEIEGEGYTQPVTYWMPFNGNVGIHDADTWRSEYGGEIYKTSGSHGCVNTPTANAEKIFNTVEIGTPVIVY